MAPKRFHRFFEEPDDATMSQFAVICCSLILLARATSQHKVPGTIECASFATCDECTSAPLPCEWFNQHGCIVARNGVRVIPHDNCEVVAPKVKRQGEFDPTDFWIDPPTRIGARPPISPVIGGKIATDARTTTTETPISKGSQWTHVTKSTAMTTVTSVASASPTMTARSPVGASAPVVVPTSTHPDTQSPQSHLTLPPGVSDSNPSAVVSGSQAPAQSGLPIHSDSNRADDNVDDAASGSGFPSYAIGLIVGGAALAIAAVIAVVLLKKKNAASSSTPIESNVESATTSTITPSDMYSPPPRSLTS